MSDWLVVVSWFVAGAGVVLFGAAVVLTRAVRPALGILLDLLLAAGLLRLVAVDTWTAVATAAALVAVRKLLVVALDTAVGSRARTT